MIDIRLINEESSINNVRGNVNWKELLEFVEYIIPQRQGAVKVFNRIVQNFYFVKDHKNEKYNLKILIMTSDIHER